MYGCRKVDADPSTILRMTLNSFPLFSSKSSISCSLIGRLLNVPCSQVLFFRLPCGLMCWVDLPPPPFFFLLESRRCRYEFEACCSRMSFLINVRVPNSCRFRLIPPWGYHVLPMLTFGFYAYPACVRWLCVVEVGGRWTTDVLVRLNV